ncbi:twin-arginine translocase subunit TatC [Tessaracoccus flavus]|uniref:Sec-independent protein translocase protein TatC n=1 Tax=Tessaracoccus flavus TaxID=1610493 RepID=A0A1Q2CF57_9ACTN|nr:twin-arginine translocase subunit TatC [Tessaracoccus flavus]AQP44754.1 twin arginine-targeting protein translocase TatC [Tessaracoccus flavus]SDZ16766.1 sec-independent protein translocase protein TatC [Tessaracoccus flavus]
MTTASTEPTTKRRRLEWLRPPQGGPGGTMSLYDHLRELRYRVTIAAGAIFLSAIFSILFYRQLVSIIMAPWMRARTALEAARPDANLMVVNNGVTSSFTFAVVLCLVAGVMLSVPVWLYQLWAFVAPGLVAKEKKYALAFIGAATPLFLAGCALGYYVWPKGIEVLLSFTPQDMGITNMQDMAEFLSMEIKIILVFGLSFILPVIVVALNMAGVVRGYMLKRWRKGVIFGSVVLAAVATPTTDPFSMLALAVPVSGMFLIAEVICRVWDKKRGIDEQFVAEFAIDLDDGK